MITSGKKGVCRWQQSIGPVSIVSVSASFLSSVEQGKAGSCHVGFFGARQCLKLF